MLGPGIGGYQILDCEWLEPLGQKESLQELIDCIHYYHYLNDYEGMLEKIKLLRRQIVGAKLLKIAGLTHHDWMVKFRFNKEN